MKKLSKKEIRAKVTESVTQTLEQLEITKTSKKTKKLVKASSRKLTDAIKNELNNLRKKSKKAEKIANTKLKKSLKAKGPKKIEEVSAASEEAKIAS